METYYRRNPAASLEPIDLGSFVPPTARRYAFRQLELMEEKGMSRAAAKAQVEQEFDGGMGETNETGGGSIGQKLIETIQKEEEMHLEEALEKFKERHGDKLESFLQP